MADNMFDRVRVVTDKFESEGVTRGSVGYVIEQYAPDVFEVEFSDPSTGLNWASITASTDDLESDED